MRSALLFPIILLLVSGCGPSGDNDLVVYSGRSKALVDPIISQFEEATGAKVAVRYGDTAQLVAALAEEGSRSSADLFWGQDAGAMGAVHELGLFQPMPDSLLDKVAPDFRNEAKTWVATSGRARTLAYAPARVDVADLPTSVLDLTDSRFRGRVGWAPTNGSFQAFVTAMRKLMGEDRTRSWLLEMKENDTKSYAKNTAIIQAIADGEVDFGLPNHYYLYRFVSENPDYPVAQSFFAPGDAGSLINVAGVGILRHSDDAELATRLVHFLLSDEAQRFFTSETFEYPVVSDVDVEASLRPSEDLSRMQPDIDLDSLRDLEGTLDLLRDVGLL